MVPSASYTTGGGPVQLASAGHGGMVDLTGPGANVATLTVESARASPSPSAWSRQPRRQGPAVEHRSDRGDYRGVAIGQPGGKVQASVAILILPLPLLIAGSVLAQDAVLGDESVFDYDRRTPLSVVEHGRGKRDGFWRVNLDYRSLDGGRVPADFYEPFEPASSPAAALVLLHGMPGTRQSVSRLAAAYARAGVYVLAISAPWARRHPDRPVRLINATAPSSSKPCETCAARSTTSRLVRRSRLIASHSWGTVPVPWPEPSSRAWSHDWRPAS